MGRGKARVMLAVVELICAREAAWVWARVCWVGFSQCLLWRAATARAWENSEMEVEGFGSGGGVGVVTKREVWEAKCAERGPRLGTGWRSGTLLRRGAGRGRGALRTGSGRFRWESKRIGTVGRIEAEDRVWRWGWNAGGGDRRVAWRRG